MINLKPNLLIILLLSITDLHCVITLPNNYLALKTKIDCLLRHSKKITVTSS